MPKLWDETIEAHRRAVHDATLDATAALVAQHGLLSVTMSQIAAETGIGRATLYKYFPDVESVLTAWHRRQIGSHLEQLAEVRDHAAGAVKRLEAVLRAYAFLSHRPHDPEISAFLHQDPHLVHAQRHLHEFIRALIEEGVEAGTVRSDVAASELAAYCLNALNAARSFSSKAAVNRLVEVILSGLKATGSAAGA